MTRISTTRGDRADISSFAPHPLTGPVPARVARKAEGVNRPAPSAPFLTAASSLAVDLIAATSMGAFMAALLIWACVFTGRI